MRTVRSFPIIAFAIPLAFAACSKDSDREAKSPDTYQSQLENTPSRGENDPTMTPASRVEESRGTVTDPMMPTPQNEGAASETTRSAPLTDAQIVALTDAANSAEVDAAKIAVAQAKNARVRKFAQMMIDQHGKAKREQEKLLVKLSIQPEESTKARDFRTSAADTERTLKAAPNDMFDKVYMDIQVADHQMLLDTLDRELIPNVQNSELKKSLEDQRGRVEQHLNQALEIQKALASSPSGASGSKLKPEAGAATDASGPRATSGSKSTGSGPTGNQGSSSSGDGKGTGAGGPSPGGAP